MFKFFFSFKINLLVVSTDIYYTKLNKRKIKVHKLCHYTLQRFIILIQCHINVYVVAERVCAGLFNRLVLVVTQVWQKEFWFQYQYYKHILFSTCCSRSHWHRIFYRILTIFVIYLRSILLQFAVNSIKRCIYLYVSRTFLSG